MPSSKDPVINRQKAREWRLANPERHREANKLWARKKRVRNPEAQREASKKWLAKLTPEQREARNQKTKEWFQNNPGYARRKQQEDHELNPARRMVEQAKTRAKKLGVPFDLNWKEVVIPDMCPVLNIPIFGGDAGFQDNSPSLDRLVPELGYVKENVRVISYRANALKRDGTLEEFEAIVAYLRRELSR